MIYAQPPIDAALDQGDILDGCPMVGLRSFDANRLESAHFDFELYGAIVLTQTCDLENQKVDRVVVAATFDAQSLVDQGIMKPADIRGPLRAGRVWGYYFLSADDILGLNEMIVDLRRLTTVRIEVLNELCRAGQRRARLLTPYREHLARHFAESYARIGLPKPMETV